MVRFDKDNAGPIWTKQDNVNGMGWRMGIGTGPSLTFSWVSNATYKLSLSVDTLASNEWTHVVAVVDGPAGDDVSLYTNGIPAVNVTTNNNTLKDLAVGNEPTNNIPVAIGSRDSGGNVYMGDVDELHIHGAALTAGEIAERWGLFNDYE